MAWFQKLGQEDTCCKFFDKRCTSLLSNLYIFVLYLYLLFLYVYLGRAAKGLLHSDNDNDSDDDNNTITHPNMLDEIFFDNTSALRCC